MITARKRCLPVFASALFAVCGLVAIEQAPAHAVAQSAAPTLQPAVWQKGVQACLSNRTSESIKLLWGNEMYPADYVIRLTENVTRVGKGEVTLKPGMKICSTGRTNLPGTMDVTVSVTYENGREHCSVSKTRPWVVRTFTLTIRATALASTRHSQTTMCMSTSITSTPSR